MVFGTTSAGGVYRTPSEKVTFILASAVGAVIGYLILEVMFGRGFKTVRGNWWICLADLVLTVGVSLVAVTGLIGYETAVPYSRLGGICRGGGVEQRLPGKSHPGLDIQDTATISDRSRRPLKSLTQPSPPAPLTPLTTQAADGDPETAPAPACGWFTYHLQAAAQ
ncbi:MAG: hypothetical protein V8Q30_01410 [Acutalibacteraceae bacterium]